MPLSPRGSKPGVSQLLIDSAIDGNLSRRLLESPEETFLDFDLTDEEKDILRRPDQRMLRLFGIALAQQPQPDTLPKDSMPAPVPHAIVDARTLPDISLAVTLVPCAQYENGQLSTISYAVWVNPLPAGADPASLPMPQGAALPGQPLTPLHAVIQVSAIQLQGRDGKPQVGLSAAFRQSSNISAAPPPETAGDPSDPPFGGDLASGEVRQAVGAVRSAAADERYQRLIDLLQVLRGGEVR
jgi:hypothetical protein